MIIDTKRINWDVCFLLFLCIYNKIINKLIMRSAIIDRIPESFHFWSLNISRIL